MDKRIRLIAQDIRIQANHIVTVGWGELRVSHFVHTLESAHDILTEIGWQEAVDRTNELLARCRRNMKTTPGKAEIVYLGVMAESLVRHMEAQLVRGLDELFLPVNPADWTFLLVGEGLLEAMATFNRLHLAGFSVEALAGHEEIAHRPEAQLKQTVVVVDAGWLSAHPMRSAVNGKAFPTVIALDNHTNFNTRLSALRAGAQLLMDHTVRADALMATLCGIAWPPAQAYRVLIVDDTQEMLKLHTCMLQNAGVNVLTVNDPLAVRGLVDKFDPDVLLLDIDMPTCQGTELASILHFRDGKSASLPVIYLTGYADTEHLLAARRSGCEDYLVNPVSPEVLRLAVENAARTHRQRRQAEAAQALETAKFDSMREGIDEHAIVSIASLDGRIIFANDKFCKISGYSREELIGQNHRIIRSSEHPPEFYASMWRRISGGNIWQGEICNRRKNGCRYWVYTTIVPVLDNEGTLIHYLSIRTDITEIKEKSERLRRSQMYANIGTWDWDLRSNELFWSERVGPLFGLFENIVKPTYEAFLSAVHPEDRDAVVAAVKDCIENGVDYNIEHRCVWPDGSVHWLQERGDVVRDNDGTPLHFLGAVQDITLRKQAEFEMKEAMEVAELASRAKSEFLASMSHELRTPLNAILGYAQLFSLNTELSQDGREQAAEIERAGKHLLSLVNDMIDLARIESGKMELSMEQVSVQSVVDGSLALVGSIASQHGIKLITDVGVCRSLMVCADYVRLRQVFINLLSNAIKYNRAQGTVRFVCASLDGRVRLSVIDTGPGIPLDKQDRLFTAFDRLGEERGTIEGSGIGLNLAKRFVETMGGTIGYENLDGKGSCFWVEFPIAGQITEAPEDDALIPSVSRSGARSARRVVLQIEDNPMNVRLMQQIFIIRKEMELRDAPTAELGIEMALADPPSVIIMDINLPGMDGYTALKVLKSDPRTAHIPILAVSANAMLGDAEQGIAAGFVAYLTKPINIKDLFDALDKAVSLIKR